MSAAAPALAIDLRWIGSNLVWSGFCGSGFSRDLSQHGPTVCG